MMIGEIMTRLEKLIASLEVMPLEVLYQRYGVPTLEKRAENAQRARKENRKFFDTKS